MTKLTYKRQYRFTDAFLISLAEDKLKLLQRDIDEFSLRGFSITQLNAILTAKRDFADFPVDRDLDLLKRHTTTEKKIFRKLIEGNTRLIVLAAKHAFKDKPEYAIFKSSPITRFDDEALVLYSKHLLSNARLYHSALAIEGVHVSQLDDYGALINTFKEQTIAQLKAHYKRKYATLLRIEKGNRLYNLIVQLCDLGKSIWQTQDDFKYNQYVLYKSKRRTEQNPPSISNSSEATPPTNKSFSGSSLSTFEAHKDFIKNYQQYLVPFKSYSNTTIRVLKDSLAHKTIELVWQHTAQS